MTDLSVCQQASLYHKRGKSGRDISFLLKCSHPYIEKQVFLYVTGIYFERRIKIKHY